MKNIRIYRIFFEETNGGDKTSFSALVKTQHLSIHSTKSVNHVCVCVFVCVCVCVCVCVFIGDRVFQRPLQFVEKSWAMTT